MNGHIQNKWASVTKAWEDPIFQRNTPNEENQIMVSYEPDNEGSPLSYEDEMNKEEVAVSPHVSHKQMSLASDDEQTLSLPHFVDALKNLLELAPTVLQREEQEMEAEWAEARDKSLRVLEQGLAALQRDVAKSLVHILDSLDRSQRLRCRARDAERRSEKERWRKDRADADTWANRWSEKWEGWSCEEEEEISGMCLEVRHQMHTAMDKTEWEREEEIAESDSAAAKQELAVMELLADELGAVEEISRRHCQFVHDRTVHLWEKIEKDRLVKTVNSEISEQYPRTVAPLAIADPCLVQGRRPLLPPITPLNEKGCKRSTLLSEAGAPTQGIVWHMEPLAEINREKKKRKKKKVDAKVGEEEEEDVGEKNGQTESIRKSWRQRLTEWLHAPLCGCSFRCY